MSTEQRYTLAEARQELSRRECVTHGHDTDVICSGLSNEPIRIVCSRCGDSWAVQPKETS